MSVCKSNRTRKNGGRLFLRSKKGSTATRASKRVSNATQPSKKLSKKDIAVQESIQCTTDEIDEQFGDTSVNANKIKQLKQILDYLPTEKRFSLKATVVDDSRSCGPEYYETHTLRPEFKHVKAFFQNILKKQLQNRAIDPNNMESDLRSAMNDTFDDHPEMCRYMRSLCRFVICMIEDAPENTNTLRGVYKHHKKDIKALMPSMSSSETRKLLPTLMKILKSRKKQKGGGKAMAMAGFANFIFYLTILVMIVTSPAYILYASSAVGGLAAVGGTPLLAMLITGMVISLGVTLYQAKH